MSDYKQYLIEEFDLRKMERIYMRLFTENRMNGNEMRDAAEILRLIVEKTRALPLPEEEPSPDKFTVSVVWNSDADDEPCDYEFNTQAEAEAFGFGIFEAEGWTEAEEVRYSWTKGLQ